MGITTRKKMLNHLYLASGGIEWIFLRRATDLIVVHNLFWVKPIQYCLANKRHSSLVTSGQLVLTFPSMVTLFPAKQLNNISVILTWKKLLLSFLHTGKTFLLCICYTINKIASPKKRSDQSRWPLLRWEKQIPCCRMTIQMIQGFLSCSESHQLKILLHIKQHRFHRFHQTAHLCSLDRVITF